MKYGNKIPTIKPDSSSLHVNFHSFHLTSAPCGDCCNLCTPSCENSVCTSEKKWHLLCYPSPRRDRWRKNSQSGSCSSHSAGTRRLLEASLRWSWTSDKWLIVSAPRKPLSLQMEAEFYVHVNHLTFEPVVHSQCEFEGVWQPDGPWPCAHRKLDPKNVAALAVSRLSNTAFQCLLMQSGPCPWSSIIFSRFSLLNLFLFYYKQIQIKITHNFLVVDFAWARRI